MYTQRDPRWKNLKLGFGTGTIGQYGCYLVSLCNGLNEKGWHFTPATFNQLLKEKQLWTGATKNYIDVNRLADVLPETFTSFVRKEPWNDMTYLRMMLDKGAVVLGKVDARAIGGSGTHFVLITGIDGNNAIIFDPWTGEHQAVYKRYNKYGNILGLRIFGVKPYVGKIEEIALDQDISSRHETILKLKSYDWYDKHWTWGEMIKFVSKTVSQLKKCKDSKKSLQKDKKALERKLETNKAYLNDLEKQSKKRIKQIEDLTEELENLRDNTVDLLDYQEKMDAVELELKECRDKLSHYLSSATLVDGLIIIINAIKTRRFK